MSAYNEKNRPGVGSPERLLETNAYNEVKTSSYGQFSTDTAEVQEKEYAITDIGAGELFADTYGDVVRYTANAKKPFTLWNGSRWEEDSNDYVNELAKLVVAKKMPEMATHIKDDDKRTKWLGWAKRMQANQARVRMLESARTIPRIVAKMSDFDASTQYVNLPNGIFDLHEDVCLPHDSALLLSKMAGAAYNPDASCERWDQFVLEIMNGDEACARFLQKATGYALMGEPVEDCLFFLYGEKTRNGKSTFCHAILNVFGDYGCTAQPETLAVQRNKAANAQSSDIARLRGARLVSMSEPEKGMKLDAALVKQLTGRDTITARFMHRDFFEFVPNFVLFMNTNHLPRVDDMTLFSSGRIFTIPFPVHFEESQQDKSLLDFFKQPTCASAILNWVLEGHRMYRREGLRGNLPEAIQEATQCYEEDSDILGSFMRECIVTCEGNTVMSNEIYRVYKHWMEENGHVPMSKTKMSPELERHGLKKKRRSSGCYFMDIALTSSFPQGWV